MARDTRHGRVELRELEPSRVSHGPWTSTRSRRIADLRLELDPAPWSSLALEVSLAEVEQDFVGEPLDGSLRGGWQGQGCVHEVRALLGFFVLGALTGVTDDEGEVVEVALC